MTQTAFTPEKPAPPSGPATSGKAIFSLILGVMSLGCSCATGLPAILLGFLALGDIKRSQGARRGGGLAIAGMSLGTVGTLLGLAGATVGLVFGWYAQQFGQSHNNLQQIGLGVHNYHDTFRALPLIGTDDPQRGLNMSWRVRMLPFIEQQALFDQVNFNEPWDSPANAALQASPMPGVYAVPPAGREARDTSYLVFTSDGVVEHGTLRGVPLFGSIESRGSSSLSDCNDGTTNTIMVVEADRDRAVLWDKPQDLKFDPAIPKSGLGHVRSGGFLLVMADGAVRFIPNSMDDETLRRLVLRDDREPVGFDH